MIWLSVGCFVTSPLGLQQQQHTTARQRDQPVLEAQHSTRQLGPSSCAEALHQQWHLVQRHRNSSGTLPWSPQHHLPCTACPSRPTDCSPGHPDTVNTQCRAAPPAPSTHLGGPSRSSVSSLSGSLAMRTGPSLNGGGCEPGGAVARKGLIPPVGPADTSSTQVSMVRF